MRLLAILALLTLTACGPKQIRIDGKWITCKEISVTKCGAHAMVCNDGMNHRCVTDFDTRD